MDNKYHYGNIGFTDKELLECLMQYHQEQLQYYTLKYLEKYGKESTDGSQSKTQSK